MSISKLAAVSAALLLALGLPLAAGAKEESKIQVLLSGDSSPSNGKGKGRSDGKMQSTFTETQATFQVHAKQLDPLGEYHLLARRSDAINRLSNAVRSSCLAGHWSAFHESRIVTIFSVCSSSPVFCTGF